MEFLSPVLYLFAFVFGTFIGSFLNVVIVRYNSGMGLGGRSQCFVCSRELQVVDLVPIASFVLLRGRCRTCKSKISSQYPLVELGTGILFLLFLIKAASSFPLFSFPFLLMLASYFLIASVLVFIFAYDLRHKIIPDEASILLALTAFLSFWVSGNREALTSTLITAGAISLIFASFWLFSGGRWMGLGDAKLVFGLSLFAGFPGAISATVLAFWMGAAVALSLMAAEKYAYARGSGVGTFQLSLTNKPITIKSELPFGPFLILGALIVFFFGIDVLGIDLLLNDFL